MSRRAKRRRARKLAKDVLSNATAARLVQEEIQHKIIEREQMEMQEKEILESDGNKKAKCNVAVERVAFVSNISFDVTAEELVMALTDHLKSVSVGPPVVHCKIRTEHANHSKSAGVALVTLSSDKVFERLLKLCNSPSIVIRDRPIKARKASGNMIWRKCDPDMATFRVSRLSIGLPLREGSNKFKQSPFEALWENRINVKFEVNGRNVNQLALEFDAKKDDERFRVEFSFGQIRDHCLLICRDVIIYRFHLRRPPVCFRGHDEHLLTKMMQSMGLGNSQAKCVNPFEFDIEFSENVGVQDWKRSVEPKEFGSCLFYEVVMPKDYLNPFQHCMGSFSSKMSQIQLQNAPQWSIRFVSDDSWSGGFDAIFKNLPFELTYLLHAVISIHKLDFRSRAEAKKLAAALQQCDQDYAESILTDAYFARHSREPLVDVLCTKLSQIDDETDDEAVNNDKQQRLILRVRRVVVTPLRICPRPPEDCMTNRILRQFAHQNDRFLRLSFSDENFGDVLQALSDDVIDNRIMALLRQGIEVAGRRFVYLAYSNSQLKEHSCWMYDESPSSNGEPFMTADEIRASMGDLTGIRIVGKHAARLAQGFSTTLGGIHVPPSNVHLADDIFRNGHCFSDGVGMISEKLALQVATHLSVLNDEKVPSAFQIRYCGSKGVLSVCPPTVSMPSNSDIMLRQSMHKFIGNPEHSQLEICCVAKANRLFLNRQIITLLSTLGIQDSVFLDLLENMMNCLMNSYVDNDLAKKLAYQYVPGSDIDRMLEAGFTIHDKDPYLLALVRTVRDSLLLDLKLKARLYVEKGVTLIGILDETELLPPNCIYFKTKDMPAFGTRVAVTRCPCLHPGDVRLLTLVDIPELHHLEDVLVFSVQGKRPAFSAMSGGDLDGDIYFIIWDPLLVPKIEYPPMEATVSASPPEESNGAVTVNDMIDFFVNHMRNDNLGRIANAHVVFADSCPEKALSSKCIELAKLHSTAVDFCKTGVPAIMEKHLYPQNYPDFMEKANKVSYESDRILGKMYRKVVMSQEKLATQTFTDYKSFMDPNLILPGHETYDEDALYMYSFYVEELFNLAQQFEIDNEAALITGFYKHLEGSTYNRNYDSSSRLSFLMEELLGYYKFYFWDGLKSFEGDELEWQSLLKASAWYKCAYSQTNGGYFGRSFAWLAMTPMCQLKRRQFIANEKIE